MQGDSPVVRRVALRCANLGRKRALEQAAATNAFEMNGPTGAVLLSGLAHVDAQVGGARQVGAISEQRAQEPPAMAGTATGWTLRWPRPA